MACLLLSQAHAERVSALRMTRVVDDIHASRAAAALRHVTRVEVALKEAVLSAIAGEKERLLAHRKEQAAHAGAAVPNMRRVLSVAEEQYRRQHR